MTRQRLDQELVRRGLFGTRSGARNAIRDGYVAVSGLTADKPALRVTSATEISVDEQGTRYVGRGALKLLAALDSFGVDVVGANAIDVGSSTGGFTEVLLERGAVRVVALDVGTDQLHPRLRRDSRVEVWEKTSIRDVLVGALGGPFSLVTVDLSFISLGAVAADLLRLGQESADWIVLFKPQFEVGRVGLSKDGVVRSEVHRRNALAAVIESFSAIGLVTVGAVPSPLLGGSGNAEALLWLCRDGTPVALDDAFKVLADE